MTMESVLSSSESFAKALKGPQTSQADKIALARQAWERADVVLPHKQEFILEWLCTVLVRSATPTSKDATAMALTDAEFWRLLKDILTKISLQHRQLKRLGLTTTGGRTGYSDRSTNVMVSAAAAAIAGPGSGHTLVDFQAPTILLRVPVIPMFAALIQRLLPSTSTSPANDSSTMPKSKSKGKKADGGVSAKKITSPMEQRPSTAVLELAIACFELLLSNSMAEWFQPTLEQYTPLVQATLTALTDMNPEPASTVDTTTMGSPSSSSSIATLNQQRHTYSQEDKAVLLSFAGLSLEHFKRLMVIQANQKKVFGLIAGKMLDSLVCARFSIQHITTLEPSNDDNNNDEDQNKLLSQLQKRGQICLESIGAILRHGLFHQDHLQEYTTSLSIASSSPAGGNDLEKPPQSYQKQLFEQIESMTKSEHMVAAFNVLPALLSYFTEESRRRQRMLMSGGLDRSSGMDTARSTEFKFFTELYTLAKNQLPELSSTSGSTAEHDDIDSSKIQRAVHVLNGLNQLLATVADLQMYQSSNDNISKVQFAYLETCFRTMSKYLTKACDLKDVPLQTAALQGLVRLAQLDDLILEAHLSRLWPTLLTPLAGGQGSPHTTAKELASVLLETHAKSRQLGNYMTSLLKALRSFLSCPEELASSPILSRGFMDRIPEIVRLYLPLAQAPFILDEFASELKHQIMASSIDEETNHSSAKKRKLNSGKGEQGSSREDEGSNNIRSASMVVALLVHFLKGLRITPTHQKQILTHFTAMYADFISPVLQQVISSRAATQRLTKAFQERLFAPALQLHYAFCKAATPYWEQALSTETLVKLTTAMTKGVSKAKSAKNFAVEDNVTLLLNRVILQHVHLCLCSPQIAMDETLTRTCQDLVEFTMTTCRLQELVEAQDAKTGGVKARWNGSLSTAKGSSFLVASWQTQVNDWMDIVCRFGSTDAMALLASVITDNVFSSPPTGSDGAPRGSTGDELTIQSLNRILLRSANMYEVARFRPVLVDAVLNKLIALLRNTFQVGKAKDKEEDLMGMVESTLQHQHQQNQASGPSFQEVVKTFAQWLSNKSASPSTKKKSKSASNAGDLVPQDHLLSLLSILHLLPIEYFDKRERDCILVLMGVLDHSIREHMRPDSTGLRSLLLCRKVSLAIMRWRNDAGLLAADPVMVQSLLAYAPWNGSATAASAQERNGTTQSTLELTKALWNTTSSMIQTLVHHAMLLATGSSSNGHAGQQLIALLSLLQAWIQPGKDGVIEHAKTATDENLSVPTIQLCILSQVCQALVQALEHLVSTLAKKKKKAASSTAALAEYEKRAEGASKLACYIKDLLQKVEAQTLTHLSKTVLSLTDEEGNSMAMDVDGSNANEQAMEDLVQTCQASMDHFELLRTLLAFNALVKKSSALHLMLFDATTTTKRSKTSKGPTKHESTVDSHTFLLSLYRLADRLITVLRSIKERQAGHSMVNTMVHLVSLLAAYTCEYLPAGSLPSEDRVAAVPSSSQPVLSEDQIKGLLTLILRVSEVGTITPEDMAMLKDSYLAMLGHLSGEMFEKTLGYLLDDQLNGNGREDDVAAAGHSRDELILVKLLEVTFLGSQQSQKRKVRKHISKLVTRMIRILQTSDSVDMVVEVLELLAGLCSEMAFELRPWEIGLILEATTTLMSPATPLLVGSTSNVQLQSFSSASPTATQDGRLKAAGATSTAALPQEIAAVVPPLFSTKDAVRVFTGVYHVLTYIARFRQEELVELIPIFTAVLQAIFHGFKSIHPSIARKQQGMHTLMASQNPFPLLTHRCLANHRQHRMSSDEHSQRGKQPSTKKHQDPSTSTSTSSSASSVTLEEPLPVECAESFARLLTTLGTKAVISTSGSLDLEPPSTTTDGIPVAGSATHQHHHHRGRQQPLDTSKAFSKHAPYLLTEYFKIQSSVVSSISLLPLRQALQPGLYALIDLCSEWEREMMMANLDATGKSLLKSLYSDYLKYHKYTGR